MKAAFLSSAQSIAKKPLVVGDLPKPAADSEHVLLRVRACGVCRTDLHIAEGELPEKLSRVILGHKLSAKSWRAARMIWRQERGGGFVDWRN